MVVIALNDHAGEKSTYRATAAFFDSTNNAVIPSSANWTLLDSSHNICNNRNAVVISPLNNSVDIVLSGNDFAAGNNETGDTFIRKLLIQAVYTSTDGSGLALKGEAVITVEKVPGLT